MKHLGHRVTDHMNQQWTKTDSIKMKKRQHKNKSPTKKRRKQLKRKNIKTVQAFTHEEGTTYDSGQFHNGVPSKNTRKN